MTTTNPGTSPDTYAAERVVFDAVWIALLDRFEKNPDTGRYDNEHVPEIHDLTLSTISATVYASADNTERRLDSELAVARHYGVSIDEVCRTVDRALDPVWPRLTWMPG